MNPIIILEIIIKSQKKRNNETPQTSPNNKQMAISTYISIINLNVR